jgi:predicted transcriptional regulator
MILKTIELRVGDFMTSEPISVEDNVLFPAAVSVMTNNGIGNLVITQNNEPSGLLTEREILSYLVRKSEIPSDPMKDVLTQSFTKIPPVTPILDAAKMMIERKKRLLVFDNEKLVGIITASDILRGFRKTGINPSLDKVMSKKIYQCDYNDSIFKAIKFMYAKRIGSVVITKNKIPYGIFTERDLLVNVLTKKIEFTERVGDYCTSPLVTTKIGIRGNNAARLMASRKIKRLILTEKDKMTGIVTARDIVEAFYAE